MHSISQIENPALQDTDSKDSQLLKDEVSKVIDNLAIFNELFIIIVISTEIVLFTRVPRNENLSIARS